MAKIRQLLKSAFTAKQLRRFCFDDLLFRPIVEEFAPDHGLADMVDRVLEYCEKNVLLDELLGGVKQANPRQYRQFFGPELADRQVEKPQEDQSAEPMPEHPIVAATAAWHAEIAKPPEGGLVELALEIPTLLEPIPLSLVRVPAGEFVMGGVLAKDRDAREDELPARRVDLPEFHIGKYPVTNLQYQAFVQATGRQVPDHWEGLGGIPTGKEHHPVVRVAWGEARAFCAWLSRETGQPFRLPTEAEWEKAARGTDGRIYPWGDEPPVEDRCNFGQNVDDGDTTVVDRYSPYGDSPYGCADMAGNVWEWCQSIHMPYPYQADDGREEVEAGWEGLEGAPGRVVRGGAWYSGPADVRCACRYGNYPGARYGDVGFRVCVAPEQ